MSENKEFLNENLLNPNETPSEFAVKPPLISAAYKKALKLGLISCLGIMIFSIGGLIIYRQIQEIRKNNKLSSIDPNSVINPTPTAAIQDDKEFFAYIKNKKEIWVVDTNGDNKTMIAELSPSNKMVFTTIEWKNKNNISYAECANDKIAGGRLTDGMLCDIKTYDITTKATNDEYGTSNLIRKFAWSNNTTYLSLIEDSEADTFFKLKAGTITNTLTQLPKKDDLSNTQAKTLFTSDNQHIIFYSTNLVYDESVKKDKPGIPSSTVEVFLVNGVKVEHLVEATDPFLLNDNEIGFKRDNQIIYRTIGKSEETVITAFNGFNSEISPNKNQIAYWYSEGNLNNVILGVFDSELNIHRNILRGIVLPVWINDDKILGIKADNCLGGTSCQLYEFQTNSISLIDVEKGNVKQIDQGKNIAEPKYKNFKVLENK